MLAYSSTLRMLQSHRHQPDISSIAQPEDKIRRLPGTLTFRDFSNDNSVLDHKLSFTKVSPPARHPAACDPLLPLPQHVPTDLERQVHQAAAALTAAVRSKLREFQMDYESSA